MKKIIVPTDFSKNALKALKYATNLVNKTKASITLVHAYQINSGTGRMVSFEHIVLEDKEQEMKSLIREIKPLLGDQIALDSLVKNGNAQGIITETANNIGADLILMGTTGAGGMKKLFMGSTASNVIKNTEIPVLAIPEAYEGENMDEITFAVDNKTLKDNTILNPLLELVKINNAHLNLLIVVNEDKDPIGIDEDLLNYIAQNEIKFGYSKISADSVSQGIKNYIQHKGSNLLCLVHHNRAWFENIFHRSVSENMAFETHIPLMVLRG
jgi:nucleotide-binding universal stress UspA family protein